MNFITLILSPYKTYHVQSYSNEEILILGFFFTRDFACGFRSYQNWVLEESVQITTCSNCTLLEKKNGFVLLSDLYSESKKPTQVKMTYQQFIQLCDDWQEKVCKDRPKEVAIKYVNDQFFIETHG